MPSVSRWGQCLELTETGKRDGATDTKAKAGYDEPDANVNVELKHAGHDRFVV